MPPKVTEYVAQAKQCPCCGAVTEGELAPRVRARASFGPDTCAQAANLTCGHHIPVYRAALLLCQLAAVGLTAGLYRRTTTAKDARRLPAFEDLILRSAARPDLDIFSSNEAERTIWPVKVR